jgi:hypothetical protein
MNQAMNERHRKEVQDAGIAVHRVRQAAGLSFALGLIGFAWVLIIMINGTEPVSEGVVLLVGTALATVVPAAGLYAASYRTSLGAARLERSLDDS